MIVPSSSNSIMACELDGTIIDANANFLGAVGYTLDEIKGKHHSMFVDPAYRNSADYRLFWEKLGRGEFDAGQYKRFGKGGTEVWLEASYNPIMGPDGKPFKVVKYATDITVQAIRNSDFSGQIDAINKAQAVIEFTLDGKVLRANVNFLNTLGYVVSRRGAERFLARSTRFVHAVDKAMHRWWANGLELYGLSRPMVATDPQFVSMIAETRADRPEFPAARMPHWLAARALVRVSDSVRKRLLFPAYVHR
eukprot:gene38569-52107_t